VKRNELAKYTKLCGSLEGPFSIHNKRDTWISSVVVSNNKHFVVSGERCISITWFILNVFRDNFVSISNLFGRHNIKKRLKIVVFGFPNCCIWISKFYYLPKLLLSWVTTRSLSLRRFVALSKIVQQTINHAASRIKQVQLQLCG